MHKLKQITALVCASLVDNPDFKLYTWCDPASMCFRLSNSKLLSSLITSSFSLRTFQELHSLTFFSKKIWQEEKVKLGSKNHLFNYFYFLLSQLRVTSKLSASPPFMNQKFTSISGWSEFFLLHLAKMSLTSVEDSAKDIFCFGLSSSSHAMHSHWEDETFSPDHI